MLRNTAYKIAKYTSWIVILLWIILPAFFTLVLVEPSIYAEGLIWGYIFIIPFIIAPPLLFLIIIWVVRKWNNAFKPLLGTFIVALVLFTIFWCMTLWPSPGSIFSGITFIIILIISFMILYSKE